MSDAFAGDHAHCGLSDLSRTRIAKCGWKFGKTSGFEHRNHVVDQYAAFIRACADDVVEQALTYVFTKDRDFQEFLKTPEARQVASTLRIRKAPVPEAAEPPAKKPANGVKSPVQPSALVAGLKA